MLSPTATHRLEANYRHLQERLQAACSRAGREPSSVRLVAISKRVDAPTAAALYALGQLDFGENRVDELERKRAWFEAQGLHVRWHLVGHLQRNKLRRALAVADVLQSCDRLELIEDLERGCVQTGRSLPLFLQLKLWEEPSKGGLAAEQLPEALERVQRCATLQLQGLMVLAPLLESPNEAQAAAQQVFEQLATLARGVPQDCWSGGRAQLSMGMSGDLELAIAAGSTCIRIGSDLFEGLESR